MTTLNPALDKVKHEVRQQHPYVVGVPSGDIKVKLNQNESPYDLPPDLRRSVLNSWNEVEFNRYPSEQPDELVRSIADYIGWDEKGIIIGNGSNELTYTLGLVFISSGTKVVLPRPMFSFYQRVVHIYGGHIVSVPPREDLGFDIDAIVDAIHRSQPAMVVVTSPNNPTSLALSLDALQLIATSTSGLVLIDEAYVEFADQPSMLDVLEQFPNVILLRTFSKAFGLAGVRIGYLIGAPALISEITKARVPFMVDRFSIHVVQALLSHPRLIQDRIESICSETRQLTYTLKQIKGIRVIEGQANFVLFQPLGNGRKLFKKLASMGILVRDMSGYPELKGYLRVTTGTPDQNTQFIHALTNAIDSS